MSFETDVLTRAGKTYERRELQKADVQGRREWYGRGDEQVGNT